MKKLFIRTYEQDGYHQFQLCAANGEALLTSEWYASKRNMKRAIDAVLTRPISPELKPGKKNKED